MPESMYDVLLKRAPLPRSPHGKIAFMDGISLACQCHAAGGLEDGWTVVPNSGGKRLRNWKPRGGLAPALPGWKWAWGELARLSATKSD